MTQIPFCLDPRTNQPTIAYYVMELNGTINNINGGARNDLHMLRMAECVCTGCDAPPTKRQCSCVAGLLMLSKHLTESKHKQQATASVKLRTLDAFL